CITLAGSSGQAFTTYDEQLGHYVLVTSSLNGGAFALSLPLPPAREMPAELEMQFRNRGEIGLTLRNHEGRAVTFTCAVGPAAPLESVVPLAPELCRGGWSVLRLAPAALLPGALAQIVLRGEVSLAHVRGRPQ